MLGFTRIFFDTTQSGLEDGLAAVEAARKVGHQRAEMLGQMMCFEALTELGEWDRAKAHTKDAQTLALRLGAMRFEAHDLAWLARIATAEGRRAKAIELLERALKICRDTGMAFTGPRVLSALALVTDEPDRRRGFLEEGEAILRSAAISHNQFWFYRDAIEVSLDIGDWLEVERYAVALEDYTRSEPLPWCDFFIAHGRALVAHGRDGRDDVTMQELKRLRDEAARIGLKTALPALDAALATVQS
jgi:tetratricopeptide (TPR) repeat protein